MTSKIKNTTEIWHSGWYKNFAFITIKSSHLALANQFVNDNYKDKKYNILGVNKKIKINPSHYQLKSESYSYKLELINNL